MPIVLNAFPLKVPDLKLEVREVPYTREALNNLRAKHGATHAFRRQGENILVFSSDGSFPESGQKLTLALRDNLSVFCFLVKDGLSRHLASLGRRPVGFTPIEIVSTKPEDNLLVPIFGEACLHDVDRKWHHVVERDRPSVDTLLADHVVRIKGIWPS